MQLFGNNLNIFVFCVVPVHKCDCYLRIHVFYSMSDLDRPLMQEIMEFIYWLVEVEELPIAKALRQILVDKQKQIHFQQVNIFLIYVLQFKM